MSDLCTRHFDRQKDVSRITQFCDQLIVPIIDLGIDQLSRGCIGIFLLLYTCEQEVEIIRDHKESLGFSKQFCLLCLVCHQLVDGIEDLLLDTGFGIQVFLRNLFID